MSDLTRRFASAGASECTACVANAEVGPAGCVCMAGFFARTAETPPKTCEPCAEGVACPRSGNAWGPTLELIVGYWQNKGWVKDVDGLLAYPPRKCKVGQWTAEQVDADPLCIGGANWTTCRDGHSGVMCQACAGVHADPLPLSLPPPRPHHPTAASTNCQAIDHFQALLGSTR